MELREANSFGGNPVDVRSFDLAAVAAEIGVPDIVADYDDNVGSPAIVRGFRQPAPIACRKRRLVIVPTAKPP